MQPFFKKFFTVLIPAFLAGGLSAADVKIPMIEMKWDAGQKKASTDVISLPEKIPGAKTTFQVLMTPETGLEIKIIAPPPQDKKLAESEDMIYIFFTGIKDPDSNTYCNIFGPTQNADAIHTNLFYYTANGETCHETPDIRVIGNNGYLTVTIPWSDIVRMLPFDPQNGQPVWKIDVVRQVSKFSTNWHGTMHNPLTWGQLKFPEFTEEQKAAACRQILKANASHPLKFYPEACTKNSFETTKPAREAMLMKLAEQSNVKTLTSGELLYMAMESVSLRENRTLIAKGLQKPEKDTFIEYKGKKWILLRNQVLPRDCNDLRILHFTSDKPLYFLVRNPGEKDIEFQGQLNGKAQHIKLGKGKKGSDITVYCQENSLNACDGKLTVHCILVEMKNMLEPESPRNLWAPKSTDHQAGCMAEGTPHPNMMNLPRAYTRRFAAEKTKLIMVGDSITQYFVPPAWNRMKILEAGNAGVEGDTTNGAIWRMDHTDLEKINPQWFVVLIGTNNLPGDTAENAVAGVRELTESLRKRCPNSNILVLGLFPRSGYGQKVDKTNELLEKLANGKNVFFTNFCNVFLAPDGKINWKLLPDGLHPSQAGYEAFLDEFIPFFQNLKILRK